MGTLSKYQEHTQNLNSELLIAAEILKVYNCRAQEILNADYSNYFPNKFLILKGCKKSFDIIIRDRKILEAIEQLRKDQRGKIFKSLKYYALYKHIARTYSHLFTKYKKKKNRKITHGFRYQTANEIKDNDSASTALHHKSKKTLEYYKK